jgi:RNA polymerase sigma-70 factor (ECF subfamily)
MGIADYNKAVDNYADNLFRFIIKNIGDEELARDIVQEAFLRLWSKRKEVKAGKAKTYLFTTAYHVLIDLLRKEKNKQKFMAVNGIETATENGFTELSDVIQEAVAQLPEIQRIVIMLRDYEGYSYKEIGLITHLSEAQVKVYIFRARTALKRYIGSLDVVL